MGCRGRTDGRSATTAGRTEMAGRVAAWQAGPRRSPVCSVPAGCDRARTTAELRDSDPDDRQAIRQGVGISARFPCRAPRDAAARFDTGSAPARRERSRAGLRRLDPALRTKSRRALSRVDARAASVPRARANGVAVPIPLPAGRRLSMEFTYDNSDGNRANPSRPPKRVTYGQRTTDEMGDVWIQVVPDRRADAGLLAADLQRKLLPQNISGLRMM